MSYLSFERDGVTRGGLKMAFRAQFSGSARALEPPRRSGSQPTTLADLQKALREEARRTPNQELIIKADKQVPHGVVVDILNLASKAGIRNVNLATRPETPMTMAP